MSATTVPGPGKTITPALKPPTRVEVAEAGRVLPADPCHTLSTDPVRVPVAESVHTSAAGSVHAQPTEPTRVPVAESGRPSPVGPAHLLPTEPAHVSVAASVHTSPAKPARTQPSDPGSTHPTDAARTQPAEPARTLPAELVRTMSVEPAGMPSVGAATPRADLPSSPAGAASPRTISVVQARWMFVFLCFVWGTTWLGMKVGISAVPPGMFAGLRWTIAGVVLLAIRKARGELVRPPPRLIIRLTMVSLLMVALNQIIQLYGLKHITAGLAAVISSALTPVALLGFSVALGQERFNPRQILAIALGVVGVFVLFGPAAVSGTLDLWEVLGAAAVIVGCLCYSFGSVLARPMMRTLAPVQMAGLTDLIGGGCLLVGSLLFEPGAWRALNFDWGWPAWIAWLYLLVPGALVSTTIYFLLVRDWGASRTGTYAFISPAIAVLVGCTWFDERLDWGDVVGMVLMLGAAGLALRPARR